MSGRQFPEVPVGAHWGWRDGEGRWWEHVPHEGWRIMRPSPFFVPRRRTRSWWRFW